MNMVNGGKNKTVYEIRKRRIELFAPLMCEKCGKEIAIGQHYYDKPNHEYHVQCD